MALLNINAGAQGNPLDDLLAQNKGSLWGNLGGLLYGHYNTVTNGGLDEGGNRVAPPDGMVTENDDRYQQAMRDLAGRTQLRNTTIGGPGGVIDPSKVTYDPRYGLLTDPSNLNEVGETFLDKYGPWLMLLPAAYGAISAGMAGAAGGEAAAATGEAAGGAAGGEAAGSMVGNAGMPGYAGAFDAEGMSGVPGMTSGAAGGGVYEGIDQLAQPLEAATDSGKAGLLTDPTGWAMANPVQALGLLQTGYGLVAGHGNQGSGNSGTKGGNGQPGNAKFGIPQQQFYVNPYIAAQIQRGYQ